MIDKILSNINSYFSKSARAVPVLTIGKGAGAHYYITIAKGEIILHSTEYTDCAPTTLITTWPAEAYTVETLKNKLVALGYTVSVTSEAIAAGLSQRNCTCLMNGTYALAGTSTLSVYTSLLWQIVHPISMLVELLEKDLGEAINMCYAELATGYWLDYWCSFFDISREGDGDEVLRKRLFMAIANMKTNNIAVKQLVDFIIGSSVTIKDVSPALFEVIIDPLFITSSTKVNAAIMKVKAAGVAYRLTYLCVREESYSNYYTNTYGKPLAGGDIASFSMIKTLTEAYIKPIEQLLTFNATRVLTETYTLPIESAGRQSSYAQQESYAKPTEASARTIAAPALIEAYGAVPQGTLGFATLKSLLSVRATGAKTSVRDYFLTDGGSITTTRGGTVVSTISF